MGPRAGVDSGEEINLRPLPGIELRFISRQTHSPVIVSAEQSRLSYLSHFLLFSSLTGLTKEAAGDESVTPHCMCHCIQYRMSTKCKSVLACQL